MKTDFAMCFKKGVLQCRGGSFAGCASVFAVFSVSTFFCSP